VADEAAEAEWASPLRKALDAPIRLVKPWRPPNWRRSPRGGSPAPTARRAWSRGDFHPLPQSVLGQLWLRGGLAVGGLYVLGITIYFAALFVQDFRVGRVEAQVAGWRELHQCHPSCASVTRCSRPGRS